jgi:DNA-binding transcriptional LysR family regulator
VNAIPSSASFRARVRTRHLLLLAGLGDHRNMRRAAAELGMSQPAATKLLQQLEEALSTKLFTRHARGMEPTLYGEVMVRHARGVLSDLAYARDELAALAEGSSGKVSVGAVAGAVPVLVTRAIVRVKRDAPRVRISVQVDSSDALIPGLLRGDLDVVLGRVVGQFSSTALDVVPLQGEPMCVVARELHPLRRKKNLTVRALLPLTWILQPHGSAMRRRVEAALQEAGITELPDILETSSILATTALLQATDMISVVPFDVAQHYGSQGFISILPVRLPVNMEQLGLITRRGTEPSPAVRSFVEALRNVEANLPAAA